MASVRKRTYHKDTPDEWQVWIVDYFSATRREGPDLMSATTLSRKSGVLPADVAGELGLGETRRLT